MMLDTTLFINESQLPFSVLSSLTTDVTGSWFLTMLLIYLIILGFSIALKIPLEYSAILLIPLTLTLMAVSKDFLGLGVALLLYIGFLLAKNFVFKK